MKKLNKAQTRLNLELDKTVDDTLRSISAQTKLKLVDIVENGIMNEFKRLKEKGDIK